MRLGSLVMALLAVDCSGSQSSGYVWTDVDETTGQRMNLHQGPMPTNETFTGVYHSPQIGELQIAQTGDSIVGRYEYDRGSCHVHARIEGSASGNLIRVNWREDHRACGRIEPVEGRAYFLYMLEETGTIRRGRLFGRWGYHEDDHQGGPWTGFKLPRRQPTFNENAGASGSEGSSDGEGSSGGEGSGSDATDAGSGLGL